MKKILSLALLIGGISGLAGCSLNSSECKYEDLFVDEVHGVRNNVFTFNDDNKTKIEEKIESLKTAIETSSSAFSISAKLNSYMDEIYFVQEQYAIINVYSCMFPNNEDIIADKLFLKTYYLELLEEYYDSLIALTKSDHRDTFFPDWDTTDYSWITDREDLYDEEYYTLEQKQATLSIEYEVLLADEELDIDALSAKLVEIVNVDNSLATKLGYSNYLEYTYADVFTREYEYSDLSVMRTNTKEYVGDAVELLSDYMTEAFSSEIGQSLYASLYGSYFDQNTNFEDLATYMGGDYEKYFNHFWDSGEYYFGNENSSNGAFVGKTMSQEFTVAYFGPGSYSSLSTVSHEVAHYMAAQVDYKDGSFDNTDLAEAQAQANEMLLAAFMYDTDDSYLNEANAVAQLYTGMTTLLQGMIVSDFENTIYTKNNLQASEVSSVMSDLYTEYGVDEVFKDSDTYWPFIFNYYSGYYISYGISIVPSLELFFVAIDDLDQAKSDYFVILNGQNQLLSVIDDLGYSDPLNSNVVKELCDKVIDFITE